MLLHVVACAQNAALAGGITVAQYVQMGHVAYQDEQGTKAWFEQWYANQHGGNRRVRYRFMP